MPNIMVGNTYIDGNLSCRSLTAPAGSLTNANIEGAAGIEYTKVIHAFPLNYAQATGSNIAAATVDLHIVKGATGGIISIEAALTGVAATGDRTATVDLHKSTGGAAFASVLSAGIQLDSGNTIRVAEAGTVSSASLVQGDILRMVVTVGGSTGTQPQGLIVTTKVYEAPQ